MKKILTALFLLILTSKAFSQGAEPDYGFRLGLAAYPTVGWVKPSEGKSNGVNLGFAYGLLADFNFAKNYSLSTGLTVTTINGKSTEINPKPYYDAVTYPNKTAYDLKYMLRYLEVPLTVKLKTEKIGDVRYYGQFGISNDFNVSARQDVDLAGKRIADDEGIGKQTKFYRAGLIVGAGLEYDIARNTSITTGLTLNNGFTDITRDKDRSVKNHYIGINFGVFF